VFAFVCLSLECTIAWERTTRLASVDRKYKRSPTEHMKWSWFCSFFRLRRFVFVAAEGSRDAVCYQSLRV
jgi:hypothetical protein